jgi:hypothetical protein
MECTTEQASNTCLLHQEQKHKREWASWFYDNSLRKWRVRWELSSKLRPPKTQRSTTRPLHIKAVLHSKQHHVWVLEPLIMSDPGSRLTPDPIHLSYFSISVNRHHDKDNQEKKTYSWWLAYSFKGWIVYDSHDKEHGSGWVAMVLRAYMLKQLQSVER